MTLLSLAKREFSRGGLTKTYLRRRYCQIQQKRNHGLVAVNLDTDKGMFAQLNWCLYIFSYCELQQKIPYIILSSSLYTDSKHGDDWFSYFFFNPSITLEHTKLVNNGRVRVSHIRHIRDLGISKESYNVSLIYAAYLVRKYLNIKQHIQEKIDRYCRENFDGMTVLGVHYRGSDKLKEAPRVDWVRFKNIIQDHLEKHKKINCIFVASDEQEFIEFINTEFDDIKVCWHDDKIKSVEQTPAHKTSYDDNYLKGEEALINCLLLSNCTYLLKTASFLSGWSKIFNIGLRVVMVNKPYDKSLWFPDKAILIEQNMASYSNFVVD